MLCPCLYVACLLGLWHNYHVKKRLLRLLFEDKVDCTLKLELI
nr:MAG TPA: hypothetical protein [Caudoviricetes sp.]